MEVLVLPPRDHAVVFVPMPDWCVGWEPSSLFLEPSPSVFAYYSSLMLCRYEADKVHIYLIAITEFFVVPLGSIVGDARELF